MCFSQYVPCRSVLGKSVSCNSRGANTELFLCCSSDLLPAACKRLPTSNQQPEGAQSFARRFPSLYNALARGSPRVYEIILFLARPCRQGQRPAGDTRGTPLSAASPPRMGRCARQAPPGPRSRPSKSLQLRGCRGWCDAVSRQQQFSPVFPLGKGICISSVRCIRLNTFEKAKTIEREEWTGGLPCFNSSGVSSGLAGGRRVRNSKVLERCLKIPEAEALRAAFATGKRKVLGMGKSHEDGGSRNAPRALNWGFVNVH